MVASIQETGGDRALEGSASGGLATGSAVVLRDVTGRHVTAEELRRLLTTDHLTGLASRGHPTPDRRGFGSLERLGLAAAFSAALHLHRGGPEHDHSDHALLDRGKSSFIG